jgi:osmoprotectant transport system substrate-binding protein
VFTTDGRIAGLGLVVLTDDKQFFPHYNPSVTMKESFFEKHPEIAPVTAPVTAALTNEVITDLNKQVDVDGRDPSIVARDWMVSKGFITKE